VTIYREKWQVCVHERGSTAKKPLQSSTEMTESRNQTPSHRASLAEAPRLSAAKLQPKCRAKDAKNAK